MYVYVCVFGHVLFTQMESITTEQHIVSFSWLDSINQGSIFFFFYFILNVLIFLVYVLPKRALNVLIFLPRDRHKLRKSRLMKTKRAMGKCTDGQEAAARG